MYQVASHTIPLTKNKSASCPWLICTECGACEVKAIQGEGSRLGVDEACHDHTGSQHAQCTRSELQNKLNHIFQVPIAGSIYWMNLCPVSFTLRAAVGAGVVGQNFPEADDNRFACWLKVTFSRQPLSYCAELNHADADCDLPLLRTKATPFVLEVWFIFWNFVDIDSFIFWNCAAMAQRVKAARGENQPLQLDWAVDTNHIEEDAKKVLRHIRPDWPSDQIQFKVGTVETYQCGIGLHVLILQTEILLAIWFGL